MSRFRNESGEINPVTLLVFGGAALAAIGALLPWAKVTSGTFTGSPKGVDGWEGKTILVFAAGMALRGAFAVRGRRGLAVAVGIGGLVIAGIAGYTLVMLKHELINDVAKELQSQFGAAGDQAKQVIEAAMASGLVTISPQIGIFLSVMGGLMGAAGGFMAAASPSPAGSATATATWRALDPTRPGPPVPSAAAPAPPQSGLAPDPWAAAHALPTGPTAPATPPPPPPAPSGNAVSTEPAGSSADGAAAPWQTIAIPRPPAPAGPASPPTEAASGPVGAGGASPRQPRE